MTFDYAEMTTRNIGFVTEAEQARLRQACVFVPGTGGMGGAAVLALARMGVGRFILADLDGFEVSNLNRQVFCTLDTVGVHKADATAEALARINPDISVEVLHADWPHHMDRITDTADVIINGTDDLGASLLLYRRAAGAGLSVIDAYASPLPSIYVTAPGAPTPETRFGYGTSTTQWDALTDDDRTRAFTAEALYILTHSSSRHYIDLDLVGDVVEGKRGRPSFAPMVITTGQLMAYAAAATLMGRPPLTDHRGWFFNPYTARVERPRPAWLAALMRPVISRALARLMER